MGFNSAAVQLGSTRRETPLPPGAPLYRHLWRGWQRIARVVGNFLSRIVTTLGYLIVMPLFAVGVRLFSDPLQLKPGPAHWTPLPPPPASVEEAQSGF
jgi:hypothetical protein